MATKVIHGLVTQITLFISNNLYNKLVNAIVWTT